MHLTLFVAQLDRQLASPPSNTSAVNHHKHCMLFQYPPYWGGFFLFHWAVPGQYRTRCNENQPTFQVLLAIKQKMARTDVGGGTSTVGPSAGEPSKDGNKQRDAQNMLNMQNMKNNMYKICKEYAKKMQNM